MASLPYLEKTDAIQFSGYRWEVKQGYYYPGLNHWDQKNVWVDAKGHLHLKIQRNGNHWTCAEVFSTQSFGYGEYQFKVIGPIDQLNKNIVLGLFVYPGPESNYDASREIDIEFARWGKAEAPPGNYTVVPQTQSFDFTLTGSHTTHRFIWEPERVTFQSFHGHTPEENGKIAQQTQYSISGSPRPPVRVHMNLWLFDGNPPSDTQEQEIIITEFTYVPQRET
jgi:hypothetical protein